MQVDSDKNLINCFTSHWQPIVSFKASGPAKVTQIFSFQHISSNIVTRYIQNQAEVISISSTSPRTTAHTAYQQWFVLKIFLSLSTNWQEPRQWSVVKGVSDYRANINMFRRCAFRVILRCNGELHTQACQLTVRKMTVFWSESIGVMEKSGKTGKGKSDLSSHWDIQTQIRITAEVQLLYVFWPAQYLSPIYTANQIRLFMSGVR